MQPLNLVRVVSALSALAVLAFFTSVFDDAAAAKGGPSSVSAPTAHQAIAGLHAGPGHSAAAFFPARR